MTPDEFLAWEREQPNERHHYVRGDVFAMAGGSPRHSFLGAQMIGLLRQGVLGSACNVYTADLRLGLASDFFVYADAVVVCSPMSLHPGTKDVVTNPSVVVEILSKSTEAYDRGDKLAGYLAVPSVRQVVLVSQREARIESYARQEDGTIRYAISASGDAVRVDALRLVLGVDDVYAGAFELPGDG